MHFMDRCTKPFQSDVNKRVKYTHGLVLGVGELQDEQYYLLTKDRSHNRSLHGYGTVSGLAISVAGTASAPEIRVAPGLAIDPHGREICVAEAQCARLNDWLIEQHNAGNELGLGGSFADTGVVYVVLCYRECEVDKVPVPVGPCHSLDRSTVASRIQDASELRLLTTPPAQPEANAVRAFWRLLGEVSVEVGGLTESGPLLQRVRGLVPGQSVDVSLPEALILDPALAPDIIDEAFRVFVTEVRPRILPEGGACLHGPRDATCVLLGQLTFDIAIVGGVPQVNGDIHIDERERPVLLQSAALQQVALASVAGPPPASPLVTDVPQLPVARTIVVSAAEAVPLGAALPDELAGAPTVRFTAGGAAMFSVALPRRVRSAPVNFRLGWAFSGTTAPRFTWELQPRLFLEGEDLSPTATPPPTLRLNAVAQSADAETLLVTARTQFTPGLRSDLGLLTLRVQPQTALVGRPSTVHLVLLEVTYQELVA